MLQPYIGELKIDKIPVAACTRESAFLERNTDSAEILNNLGAINLQRVLKQYFDNDKVSPNMEKKKKKFFLTLI